MRLRKVALPLLKVRVEVPVKAGAVVLRTVRVTWEWLEVMRLPKGSVTATVRGAGEVRPTVASAGGWRSVSWAWAASGLMVKELERADCRAPSVARRV